MTDIAKEVYQCNRCQLRMGADSPVPGIGEKGCRYMIIGEAPGRDENKAGVPFVGAAGKRLDKLMKLAGIDVNDCYVTNVCKCHPPQNKTPNKREVRTCIPYLIEEIKTINPEYIIVLGNTPLSLFSPNTVSQMHGTLFKFNLSEKFYLFRSKKAKAKGKVEPEDDATSSVGIDREVRIIAQYHPAAALHNPRLWSTLLNDWENLPEEIDHGYTVVNAYREWGPGTVALDTENGPDGKIAEWSVAYRDADKQMCIAPYYGKRPDVSYSDKCQVVFHNAKWDLRVMRNNGMQVPTNPHDTMIAAYCMGLGKQNVKSDGSSDTGLIGGLGLKYLARRYLGMDMKTWEQVKDHPELKEAYNFDDSISTLLLWEKWRDKLPWHYWNIDMPLLPVLMDMEDRGICVDGKFLDRFKDYLDAEIEKFNLPINPHSPQQIAKYVYGTLGIKPWKFTQSRQPSTEAEVLETIDDPVVQDILRFKRLQQERNTYVGNYAKKMAPDGRIHCDFKQTSTTTGRLSSANPNLQNVPKEKSEMRKLFVAPAGKKLVRMDYSQLELRVFAALTGERAMLDAFQRGRDIHQETADLIGATRTEAKTMNFLMLYGGSAFTLSQQFHKPVEQCEALIASYYKQFPTIQKFFAEIEEKAMATKEVVNYYGRRRRIDALFAEDYRVKKAGLREAINMPIQGAAGEVVKLAMIDLHYRHSAPMLLQVHDELVFEVPEADAEDYAQWLREYVPTIVEINGVQFPVEVSVADNWKEAT